MDNRNLFLDFDTECRSLIERYKRKCNFKYSQLLTLTPNIDILVSIDGNSYVRAGKVAWWEAKATHAEFNYDGDKTDHLKEAINYLQGWE